MRMTHSAAEIVGLSAEAMGAEDAASRSLGMAVKSVGPGCAVVSMRVAANMVNGHGFCHGGYIFALADSAFTLACNSHGERQGARLCHISYLAPGRRLGMRLTAAAQERRRAERNGIYDVAVRAESGEAIAELRSHSRAIPGSLVPL
jgi:phenylacetic acid degradation protein PaaD